MTFYSMKDSTQCQQRRTAKSDGSACSDNNPFSFRTSKLARKNNTSDSPMSVYVGDSSSSLCSNASVSSSSSATKLIKVLTFLLVGFAGGLLYHLILTQHAVTGQEQLLQANDQIVHQLAAENQQHTREVEQLQQKLKQQQDTTQRLRKRNELIHTIEEQEAHPDQDPHAILWSHEVHDARLEAAHRQAEMLLSMRQQQQHDASEV